MNISLINTITILMMPTELATPGLLKRKIFRNKVFDVIILHLIQIILSMWSCDQRLVTLAFLEKKVP